MRERRLLFNGIDATTGRYALPAMGLRDFARVIRADRPPPIQVAKAAEAGIDGRDLASAGWGVVFPEGIDPAIREALAPLLEHRREQATRRDEGLYRELTSYPGESKRRFLPRHRAAPGPVDPTRLPFYLLLVGGPESPPLELQYGLDVQRAVGRLAFDSAEEYACYARSVVACERRAEPSPRTLAVFGVRNPDDPLTEASVEQLARPLAAELAEAHLGWEVQSVLGSAATRERLGRLMGGGETPSLLFTAGHAALFPKDHPRQRAEQGALICHDWPGPRAWSGPIAEEHLFAARDVTDDARPLGLVSFHFACCSAGTPRFDTFELHRPEPRQIASEAFVARLPQRLLAHPRGGALAVIGHVDRAWGHSFQWPEAGGQIGVFASTLRKVMAGDPVGLAMEDFGARYAELSTELHDLRWQWRAAGAPPDDVAEAHLWAAFQDARNYVILGDPAVRLRPEAAA